MRASQFDRVRREPQAAIELVEQRFTRGRAVGHATRRPRLEVGDGGDAGAARALDEAARLAGAEQGRELRCLGHGRSIQNDS